MEPNKSFSDAADMILDAVEEAFEITAPHGRSAVKQSLISILEYYFTAKETPGRTPKEGPC